MNQVRVGIIGVQPGRSWGAVAHVPALRAVAGYEISAICTTKQESANAAATEFSVPHAFGDYRDLVASPEVDMVVIAVKLPHHRDLVRAAIGAGKDVYCEWPLGNGLEESKELADLARKSGVRHAIGLQARAAPALNYVRDLVRDGFVGDVLSSTLIGSGAAWGAFIDAANAYTADRAHGVTLLTIPVAHAMDAVCMTLGQVTGVSTVMANRRKHTVRMDTGEALPLTSEDDVAFVATLGDGVVLSAHYRGGSSAGTGLLWEIHGTAGDLRVVGAYGHMQIADLTVLGAHGPEQVLAPLTVPETYYHTGLRDGPALNVAEAYVRLLSDVREGTSLCPTFDDAVFRYRMVDAIARSTSGLMRVD